MLKMRIIISLMILASIGSAANPGLVPLPKRYTPLGGEMKMEGMNIFIPPDNKQCEIGADEINLRIKESGGKPGTVQKTTEDVSGSGIYILPVDCEAARKLIKKYSLKITKDDPGTQGYIIHSGDDQIVVVGSDNVGALYGAMTLRQMIRKTDHGVIARKANVYDKPDFIYRAKIGFRRGLSKLANGEKDAMSAYKTGIDWLMRFKINKIDEMFDGALDPRSIGEKQRKLFAEVNQYAIDRGIITHAWMHNTAYDGHTKPKGLDGKTWPCVYDSRPWYEGFYCWSADEENDRKIDAAIDFLKECKIRQLTIHPVDGGGTFDPCQWSKRCQRCRDRWKDDERWKATVHVMSKWIKAAKKKYPELIVGSCLYPYGVHHAKPYDDPEKEAIRKQNVDDYRKHCNENLPKDFYAVAWAAKDRELAKKFMDESFKGRKIAFLGQYPHPLGVFTTCYRYYGTSYFEDSKGDMFIMTSADGMKGKWMSIICAAEFGWNTKGPGSEEWKGLFYDVLRDHSGPRVIMEEWLPNACGLFWGDKVGPFMAKFYASDIWPRYICFPDRTISDVNRHRLSPYAGTDPKTKKILSDGSKPVMIVDGPELMASQVKKFEFAWSQLREAYKCVDSLDRIKQKVFMYYYRRVPLWLMIAKARLAFRQADKLSRQGDVARATEVLTKGLSVLDKDHEFSQNLLKECSRKPALEKLIVVPDYKNLRQKLSARLDDLTYVMKPRRVGRFIRIGVIESDIANGVIEYFKGFENVKVSVFKNLNLRTLDQFDCVFLENSSAVSKPDFFTNLPIYVQKGGGGVVLEHVLCGSKRFEERTPFPDIVKYCPKRVDIFSQNVFTTDKPVLNLKPNHNYKMMYVDAFVPVVEKDGFIVAVDKDKQPVVVAGKAGYGKVVFNGSVDHQQTHAYAYEKTILTGFNAALAKAAVEWFTGVMLKEK